MFSKDLKRMIANKVQQILQETCHPELPSGEIGFILHVDGKENWSWANIVNNHNNDIYVPEELIRNLSLK